MLHAFVSYARDVEHFHTVYCEICLTPLDVNFILKHFSSDPFKKLDYLRCFAEINMYANGTNFPFNLNCFLHYVPSQKRFFPHFYLTVNEKTLYGYKYERN